MTVTTAPDRPVTGETPLPPDTAESPGHTRPALLMMAPFLVLYLLFVIGPTLYMFLMSLFDTSLVRPGLGSFAGLRNYTEALGDAAFWASMWHTLWFTILTTPPLVILAFLLALMADRVRRGRWFFRLAFFLPYILPSAVVALIWMWMYTPELGLLSRMVTALGFAEPSWLGDPDLAMWSLALTTVWWTLGFNFVLYLAGLQDIPRELYEAASMDGAGPVQQVRRITVPMLSRTTSLVVVLQVIASLKVFDQMYIMTSGGPNFSTRPALEYIYDVSFTDFRVGYASAVSTLFFLLILAVSTVWVVLTRRQEERL
ncbi:sugar ABC transporter permease [Actinoplanes sp. NBC_00393]|uniref:carbohydrate ABC transporter permease n=1 Tax=Actinoplanes sp. NBC_00393 TaxID=2975953 RepID=UPI002E1C434A